MTSTDSPPVTSTTEAAPVEQVNNSTSTPLIKLVDGMPTLPNLHERETNETKQTQM